MNGERLKRVRTEKGLKQYELAKAIGIQPSMISRYESNRDSPSDPIKKLIAQYLNVTLDYFLDVVDLPAPCYNEQIFFTLEDGLTNDERVTLDLFYQFMVAQRGFRCGQ